MSIEFRANLDVLAELIGTAYGIDDSIGSDSYVDALVQAAHSDASFEFDLETAASAGAGYLTHMFEFGVPGITRGPARVPDPTSEAARLYVHNLVGKKGSYDIGYLFRPAVVPNPQPTTAHTGVATKYLRKLSKRKYIFRNRAMVTETGTEVSIKPRNGEFLFVPFYGEASDNPLNKRGFMMWHYPTRGPITVNPGRSVKGTFSAHFERWWASQGEAMMSKDISDNIQNDIDEALRLAAVRAATLPVDSVVRPETYKTVKSAKAKTQSVMNKRSKARKGSGKRR